MLYYIHAVFYFQEYTYYYPPLPAILVSRVFLGINVFEINIEEEGKEKLASVSTIMTGNVAFSSLLPTMSFPVQIFSPAS